MNTQRERDAGVLYQLADDIECGRRRWVQGAPNEPGECCLVYKYTASGRRRRMLSDSQYRAVFDVLPSGNGGLVFWNDELDRTQEEVVKVLRDAADYLGKLPS